MIVAVMFITSSVVIGSCQGKCMQVVVLLLGHCMCENPEVHWSSETLLEFAVEVCAWGPPPLVQS